MSTPVTPDCRYKRDRLYRRCNCPKWIEGRYNGERIRKSASTRLWKEAEEFRQKLEDSLGQGLTSIGPATPLTEFDPEGRPAKPTSSPPVAAAAEANSSSSAAVTVSAPAAASLALTSIRRLPVTYPPPQSEIFVPGRQRARVRTISELYPEVIDSERGEDPLPSCSAVEALNRQEPFINQTLASSVLAMLAQLLRYGKLMHHGAFFNAKTGQMSALPVDPALWSKTRLRSRRSQCRS